MRVSRLITRCMCVIALGLGLTASSGCAYFHNRWHDFSQMADIGVTWSDKNQIVLYASFESVLPLGYAHFDGHFAGWGGGQFGVTRNSLDAWGAIVWGHEKVGWEDFDVNNPSTLFTENVGLIGLPVGLFGDSNPNYVPS